MSKYITYFGSYADKQSPSLYAYEFDEATGRLTFIESLSGLKDPTFIAIDEARQLLYTYSQAVAGEASGTGLTYKIDPVSGKLSGIGEQPTSEPAATHINLDHAKRQALMVSYGGGTVSLFPLQEDGTIGPVADKVHHQGKSVVQGRQDSAHPHSIYTDPSDQFVIVPDLGLDKLIVYRLDRDNGKLQPHDEVAVAPGSGPRHFAFHPALPYAYVIQELSSTVTAFTYDRQNGKLTEIQSITTLPADFEGTSSTAEVQISPCGSYLYGSNRGHDSIVVFSIDKDSGKLSLVQHQSTLGQHPRHFSLTPSGSYLLAANKDSNSVHVFRVDKESGKLHTTGEHISIAQPTCVRFFKQG
ncbi:lactonase family protein [Paenibacillus rigui]|nr:lactonase family protein [Paenibacillus rigui]